MLWARKENPVKHSDTAQACRPQFAVLDLRLVIIIQSSRCGLIVAAQHRSRPRTLDENAITKGNLHPNEEEAPGSDSAPQSPPS